MYALIRDARAHIQNVQSSVAEVRKALTLTDAAGRAAAAGAALAEAESVLPPSVGAIAAQFAAVDGIFEEHPEIANYFRDWVVYAQNAWLRALAALPQSAALSLGDLQPLLDRLDPYLSEAVYWCGYITIPSRLREAMESLRIGETLDFNWAFQEELPPPGDRKRILLEVSRQPLFLNNGVVDLGSGLVYRVDPDPRRRRRSLLRIAWYAVIGFPIAIAWCYLGQWLGISGWFGKPENWKLTCTAYLFLLIGSAGHVLVNALKQHRGQQGTGSFTAMDDWVLWAHVYERSIKWSIVYLWCGLIMLAWTNSLDWRTAFFAGYSIDSVIDLFLDRVTKVTDQGAAAVKRALNA